MTSEKPKVKSNNKKYLTLIDIPGVNSDVANKLQNIGFYTVKSLAMATVKELKIAGFQEKKALSIIDEARSSTGFSFIRVNELIKARQEILCLTTSSKLLDSILGGGIESQSITEFYGEYGSGKTQICHQLCVNAQLPIQNGGLNGSVLYIDTENTFRPERIFQMAAYLNLNPKQIAENIIYAEAYNSEHQISLLDKSEKIMKNNNVKLLIVDSLTGHFRSEYIGREMLAFRQQKLNNHMHKIARLAKTFNAVVVVTNQVSSRPDAFLGNSIQPVGGNIVGHVSHTRVFLRKASHGSTRIARLVSSPHLPEKEEIFKITENGIEDTGKEKNKLGVENAS